MTNTVEPLDIRERLKDLNTKAYYLLVALSFVYRTNTVSFALKLAFTLTAVVAVLPVQDYVTSASWLERIRFSKMIGLAAALVSALWWIWATAATPN